MSIIAPSDAIEMKKLINQTVNLKGPLYVRIARGGEEKINSINDKIIFGKGLIKIEPKTKLIISTGIMTQIAIKQQKINR